MIFDRHIQLLNVKIDEQEAVILLVRTLVFSVESQFFDLCISRLFKHRGKDSLTSASLRWENPIKGKELIFDSFASCN